MSPKPREGTTKAEIVGRLVASTAAFQPTPGYAVYAAAKSYVLSFGGAINRELRGTGVSCTTICPGVTETPFFDVAGQNSTNE
jgi:short-subunit dehydrogenase